MLRSGLIISLSVAFTVLPSSPTSADPTLESVADYFSNSQIVHLVEPDTYWGGFENPTDDELPFFQSSMDYWIQGDVAYKELHYFEGESVELVLVKAGSRSEYLVDNGNNYRWDLKRQTPSNTPVWQQLIVRARQGRLRKVRETKKVSYYDIKKLVRRYREEPRGRLKNNTFLLAIEKASGRPLFFRTDDAWGYGMRNYRIDIKSRLPSAYATSVFDYNEITMGRQPDRHSTPIGFTSEAIYGQVKMPLYWLGENLGAYKLLSANKIDESNMQGYMLSYGRGRQRVEPGSYGDLTVLATEVPESEMADFQKEFKKEYKGKRKYKYREFTLVLDEFDSADSIYLFHGNHYYIIIWYGGESVKRARRFLNTYWKPLV